MKVLLLLLATLTLISAKTVVVEENVGKEQLEFRQDGDKMVFTFNLLNYDSEEIVKGTEKFTKISIDNPEFGESDIEGMPWVPILSKGVAVPKDSKLDVTIDDISTEVMEGATLYPREGLEDSSFNLNSNFYSGKGSFPENFIQTGDVVGLRDVNFSPISIFPIQYNSGNRSTTIVKSITFTIRNSQKGSPLNREKISKAFLPMYRSMILNWDSVSEDVADYQKPSYLMIYKPNTNVAESLEYLIDWRNKIGFETHFVSTNETGTSQGSIKSYIQNAYNSWDNPPEYLAIVGDVDHIPTGYSGGGEGDQVYALLEGGDIVADIFVGRLSYSSVSELQSIVAKTVKYEKSPYTGNMEWFREVLLVGDPSTSGASCISTNKYIKEMILSENSGMEFDEAYSGNFVDRIADGLNDGKLYMNYRGWYGMSGWGNSNISSLNNGPMSTFAVFLTCDTGSFASGTSRSEKFIRVGTPSSPKGAVAAIGTATTHTHTCYNNTVNTGIFSGVFKYDLESAGASLANGKLHLFLNFPYNQAGAVDDFSYWNNLMGDPAVQLWTGTPKSFDVETLSQFNLNSLSYSVKVVDNFNEPIEGASVVLSQDENYYKAVTNSEGIAVVECSEGFDGSYNLTVFKYGFMAKNSSISTSNGDLSLTPTSFIVDDGNNGVMETGEELTLNITMKNLSTSPSGSFKLYLSSDDQLIDVETDSLSMSSISGNSTGSGSFQLKVNNGTIDGDYAHLNLKVKSGSDIENHMVKFRVSGPNCEFVDIDNTVLNPGEVVSFPITLKNHGSNSTGNMSAILSCEDDLFDIVSATINYPSIGGGMTQTPVATFTAQISQQLIPGTIIPVKMDLEGDSYEQSLVVNLTIGDPEETDPTGPDSYGYFIYDNFDEGYDDTPEYEWIEISPDEGGMGTSLNLSDNGDNGDIETLTLPFTMRFYGEEYDEITICTNGWISPGVTEQKSYMNWHLPGPLGPSPMIAPFWDDLKTGGNSDIAYYYDSNEHFYIVEWSKMNLDYNNAEETFQAIIYDPAYHETSNGDSKIKFQYKTINNEDQGQYGGGYVNHGEYGTVGIEDHTGLRGVEYTYSRKYPDTARELEDGLALMITGMPVVHVEPYFGLNSIKIIDNNGNGVVERGENFKLRVNLKNIAQNGATDLKGTISSLDPYATINLNEVSFSDLISGASGSCYPDFDITISETCPQGRAINFDLQLTHSTGESNTIPIVVDVATTSINFVDYYIKGEDNVFDPYESGEMVVLLENGGEINFNIDEATISTTNPNITITEIDQPSSIPSKSTLPFRYSVEVGGVSVGTSVTFNLKLVSEGSEYNYPIGLIVGQNFEGFESNSLNSHNFTVSPQGSWQVINSGAYEGEYCIKSSNSSANSAKISLEIDVADPSKEDIRGKRDTQSFSFYRKLDNQYGAGSFKFYLDGELKDEWEWSSGWTEEEYDITPGVHTLTWEFYNPENGSEAGYVDRIELPKLKSTPLTDGSINIERDIVAKVGEESVRSFTIYNSGNEPLDFTLNKVYNVNKSSGSDQFGYSFKDSNEPDGPEYSWFDISSSNTQVEFTHNCVAVGPFDLGFDFNFYGEIYNQFIINPNGWVGFGQDFEGYQNQSLPTDNGPKPAILGFWDDLHPADGSGGGGTVHYKTYDDKVVVWWNDVEHWDSDPGTYDFEIIIYKNGEIEVMYRSISGNDDSATLGIQNQSGTIGLNVSHNQPVGDQYCVKYYPPADWAHFDISSGTIGVGESENINLTIDGVDQSVGTEPFKVVMSGNFYNGFKKEYPVNVQFITESPYIATDKDSLLFDLILCGDTATLELVVENNGFETLDVTGISIPSLFVTASSTEFSLEPNSEKVITFTFEPGTNSGMIEGDIVIHSNSIVNSEYNIFLQAESIITTDIDDNLPQKWSLEQNYPNPFNPETTISFSVKEGYNGFVKIDIYNSRGQVVRTLVNSVLKSGIYSTKFDGSSLSSGVYYYSIVTDQFRSTKSMVLIK